MHWSGGKKGTSIKQIEFKSFGKAGSQQASTGKGRFVLYFAASWPAATAAASTPASHALDPHPCPFILLTPRRNPEKLLGTAGPVLAPQPLPKPRTGPGPPCLIASLPQPSWMRPQLHPEQTSLHLPSLGSSQIPVWQGPALPEQPSVRSCLGEPVLPPGTRAIHAPGRCVAIRGGQWMTRRKHQARFHSP